MKKLSVGLCLLIFMLIAGHCAFAQQVSAAGSYYNSLDGVKIYYEIKGDGFPVILVHGFSGTGEGWKKGQLYTVDSRLQSDHIGSAGQRAVGQATYRRRLRQ